MNALRLVTLLALATVISAAYDRNVPYVAPDTYYAELEFQIPYISFKEPVTVHGSTSKSLQRLSYFSGMDTYIYSPDNYYMVVPVFDTLQCVSTNSTATPVRVFPDASVEFTLSDETEIVTTSAYPEGVKCDVWKFSFGDNVTNPQSNSSASLPNDVGYVGHYFFYRNVEDGSPVSFRATNGHNVVLGGSHYDHYILDYLNVAPLNYVDPTVFQPPTGMPCPATFVTPSGPTTVHRVGSRNIVRSNPADDLRSLFPTEEGARYRSDTFARFEREYSKTYTSDKERAQRASNFHTAMRFVNGVNRRNRPYSLSLNHMADWTHEERLALNGRTQVTAEAAAGIDCGVFQPNTSFTPPKSVDWRSTELGGPMPSPGYVRPAVDQGTCGSCFSFGAAAAAEAAHQRRYQASELITASEQSVLDCTWETGNQACGGGTDFLIYSWLLNNNDGKWADDASYGGYLNQDGFCHYDIAANLTTNPFTGKGVEAATQLESCTIVTKQYLSPGTQTVTPAEAIGNLTHALGEVEGRVLSVAIDATLPEFYFYDSGVFYEDSCKSLPNDLDHQVTAVGYGVDPVEGPYTIIRNSWSDYWGENGFVKISQRNNCCGVGTQPTFVTVV